MEHGHNVCQWNATKWCCSQGWDTSSMSLNLRRHCQSAINGGKIFYSQNLERETWFFKVLLFLLFFRGAQSKRPVPVSSRAVHAADHSVPRLRSEHRRRSSQCSPQCTAVPQNHGWREVTLSTSSQTRTRHTAMAGWISTLNEEGTFVKSSNNVNYLRFGNGDFFCPQMNPRSFFSSVPFCSQWRFSCPKTHAPPFIDIICHQLFLNAFLCSVFVCSVFRHRNQEN